MADPVTIIDCHYVYPQTAAAFLLGYKDEYAFIENNTTHALPYLLKALEERGVGKEQVKYIIITHVHLDHAGATGHLAQTFPLAKVVAHPRAARHVIDPSRLIQSARQVYGDELFDKLYGQILPVPPDRVLIPEDRSMLYLGGVALRFFYTRGHANHHFVIFDEADQTVYTGDSFGIGYPLLQKGSFPFIYPSTTPTDFDPEEAHKSYDLIADLKPRRVMLTHFGEWVDVEFGRKELHRLLLEIEEIYKDILSRDISYEQAHSFAQAGFERLFSRELERRGIYPSDEEWKMLGIDLNINAQGLVFSAMRQKKKNHEGP
ncbi:MAG: MBL fold metallo-hydrolase [Leptospiraceae bacterium]|nr:MBL fold metallo-hydrolase [Leptospiraceae bacterium]MDW8306294.1 MBL fold metallo-hydrolase [Leptospiraceae bacterium]